MSSQSSGGKPEVKTGGMKPSASAPSSLPSAKTSHKGSLFENEDEDDLFAPTKESRYLRLQGCYHDKMIILLTVITVQYMMYRITSIMLYRNSLSARNSYLSFCLVPLRIVRRSLRELLSCLKTRMMIMMIKDPFLASNLLLSTQPLQPRLLK